MTITTASMDHSISMKKQCEDATVSEVSFCSIEVSKLPDTEIAFLANENDHDVEGAFAIERSEESSAPWSRARQSYHFLRIVAFTVYRELLALICITNLIALVVIVASDSRLPLATAATAAVANLTAAVFERLLSLCYALLAILVAIAVLALPQIRDRHHNLFENAHRLGG